MRSANIYQDKHQDEAIFVTSVAHFSILFLQKKCLTESSGFGSAQDVSPYDITFTFTGKERDEETGFSYFGARYYDSDLSVLFLSVDPMADKYPNISPYAYCAWNPVKFVDPDGRDGVLIVDTYKKTIKVKVKIVFYANSSSVNSNDVKIAAKMYEQNIKDNWCKDNMGKKWRTEYKGESYVVLFDINVSVDNSAKMETNRDYDGMTNYIGIDKVVPENRNSVLHSNKGLWKYTLSNKNSGGHEFGHFLGLKDRYTDGNIPVPGWENNIMARVQNRPDKRNIDALINRNGYNLIEKQRLSEKSGLFRSCSRQRIIKYYLNSENKE